MQIVSNNKKLFEDLSTNMHSFKIELKGVKSDGVNFLS